MSEVRIIRNAIFIDTDQHGNVRVANVKDLTFYPVQLQQEIREDGVYLKATMPISYELISKKEYKHES